MPYGSETRVLLVLVAVAVLSAYGTAAASLARPYLALFTFQNADLATIADEQLRILEASPYDGMAIWLVNEDTTRQPPDLQALQPRLAHLKQLTRKDLWPVVFLNRIIEQDTNAPHHEGVKAEAAFAGIRGMDLDDAAGAMSAFVVNWRRSLQVARVLESPGIAFDPEFYNNYDLESLSALAKRRGESESQTLAKLRALGARMADIAQEEYPGVVVWSAFTRLGGSPDRIQGVPGYILQAMLDRAREKRLPLRLIEGGEDTIGYVHRSAEEVMAKIAAREKEHQARLGPDSQLIMGGTVAPWLDTEHRAYWMKDTPTLKRVEDFEPVFEALLARLPFVWVYGAGNAYNVWEKPYRDRYDPVLAAAKNKARRLAPPQS